MVCLHGTDPATIYLSAWARVDGMTVADLDRALYDDRSLVKHLAMRRTLFVFPREALRRRPGGRERPRRRRRAAPAHPRRRGGGAARGRRALAGRGLRGRCWPRSPTGARPRRRSCARRSRCSRARSSTARASRGAGRSPIGPRVLTTLSAAGRIVRASNDGGWTTSRPRWASMSVVAGRGARAPAEAEGVAGLVERWLRAFGPGTEADIKWWLGSTLTAVRRALADARARSRSTSTGGPATCCPTTSSRPSRSSRGRRCCRRWTRPRWAGSSGTGTSARTRRSCSTRAATPGRPSGGTGGSSAAGGRARTARSSCSCSRTSARTARRALEREAERLTEWLGGARVLPRFPSPLSKARAGR